MPTLESVRYLAIINKNLGMSPIFISFFFFVSFSFLSSGPIRVRGIDPFGRRGPFPPTGCRLTLTPTCYVRFMRDYIVVSVYSADWRIPSQYSLTFLPLDVMYKVQSI